MPKKNEAEHRKTSLKPELDRDHHMKNNPGKKDKYVMLSLTFGIKISGVLRGAFRNKKGSMGGKVSIDN